ncbi:MAG: tetratricopeptide repeat protein, partial [Brevundimonas sp.]
ARGEHAEAIELLRRSLAVAPDDGDAWLTLALSLHALGDEAGTLDACREAVRVQPTNDEARRLILQLALAGQRAGQRAGQQAPATPRLWPGPDVGVAFAIESGLADIRAQNARPPSFLR